MFTKTNVTLANLTREVAQTFSRMLAVPGERKLRQPHVTHLYNLAKAGLFVSPTWAVIVDQITGIVRRANGQHSSTMLANLTDEEFAEFFPNGLNVTIEEWTTTDFAADAYNLFMIFDDPRQTRTNLDVMGFHKAQFTDLADLDEKFIVSLTNGMALYERSVPKGKGQILGARERGGYVHKEERRSFILWAAEYQNAIHAWMFGKPGVVAEMYGEWRYDQPTASSFWSLALTEGHPDVDHETRELTRTLKEFVGKPKIKQERFRKEVAKQWKRYVRLAAAKGLGLTA